MTARRDRGGVVDAERLAEQVRLLRARLAALPPESPTRPDIERQLALLARYAAPTGAC